MVPKTRGAWQHGRERETDHRRQAGIWGSEVADHVQDKVKLMSILSWHQLPKWHSHSVMAVCYGNSTRLNYRLQNSLSSIIPVRMGYKPYSLMEVRPWKEGSSVL